MWTVYNPVALRFGWGALSSLPDIIPPGRILIVTGRSFTKRILDPVLHLIPNRDIEIFDQIEANPSSQTIEDGIRLCRDRNCAVVLGLGGGSPLDAGKAIAFLSNKKVSVLDVMHKRAEASGKGLPFIAVPTTAGSGSEVTPYSILTDTVTKKKISIAHPDSYPISAVLDPDLTLTMPALLTASTGLDVLAHSIESAWSRYSQAVSRSLAIGAARLVFQFLPAAVQDGADRPARENMLLASAMAGMAISHTGTTINHSISYPLTLYRGVPHGFACALSLPAVMRYNLKASREVLDQMAGACGFSGAAELITKVENLIRAVGCPQNLGALNITETDLDWLNRESYGKNAAKSPEKVDPADMLEILRSML